MAQDTPRRAWAERERKEDIGGNDLHYTGKPTTSLKQDTDVVVDRRVVSSGLGNEDDVVYTPTSPTD